MSELDVKFLQKIVSDELDRRGGGGHSGGMDDILRRINALEADTKSLVKDVAEIKGKLSNLPTTFQMVTWFIGVSFALTGLVFTISRLTGHQ